MGTEGYQTRVGMALAAVRMYLELTQEQLAAVAGVSVSTISNYEAGRHAQHAEPLVVIARSLDIPLELLLDPPASRQAVLHALASYRQLRQDGLARD